MVRLLLIEDEAKLQQSVRRGLGDEGYFVVAVSTGREAQAVLATEHFDAVLLDLMLPDHDGFRILESIRAGGRTLPVIVITARDSIDDRVSGLDRGADDYLIKPFSFAELVARLRALLRRSSRFRNPVLRLLDLELDLFTRSVSRAGRTIDLTQRQFELLAFLMDHPNETLSRETIAHGVWKESTASWSNVIEVQINGLRKKIEHAGQTPILHTIRGVGYRLGVRS